MAPRRPAATDSSDEELVARVIAREPRAEAELARRVLPHVRAVARAMLQPADADDAIQAAVLIVLDRVETWKQTGSLEHWARAVGARACLRVLRDARRHRADRLQPRDALRVVPMERNEGELREEVRGFLEALPEPQREAIVLKHIFGYTMREVAEILDVPLDTAKSRLFYGRRAMREQLRREDQGIASPADAQADGGLA